MPSLPYDVTSKESILQHGRKLLGHSLREVNPNATADNVGRGGLGQAVERFHFNYQPNSEAAPDFAEAGLELKCSPLKELADGSTVAKERLVLNIINYLDEAGTSFKTSSFWKKNAFLLLMFYLHQAGVSRVDLVFKLIRNWSIPPEDLKIFKDDWRIIHNKILRGRAHEIHEGDTFYLAACEKGSAAGAEMREQPGTSVRAQQRAYSIKKCYMDQIVLESLLHPEMTSGLKLTPAKRHQILRKRQELGAIVRNVDDYEAEETFEDLVIRRFRPYIGLSADEIACRAGAEIGSPKSMSYTLCRAILGVKQKRIAEFEKAGVLLKTIRLEHDGGLKEAMSFSTIKYYEIAQEEEWDSSEWHDILTRKFFFVVFRKPVDGDSRKAVLEDVFFWSMPAADLHQAEAFWKDTRDKVRSGNYDHFMRSTEHPICHVRPKAQNAADTAPTPQGSYEKKKCYWLNRPYVLRIVESHAEKARHLGLQVLHAISETLKYRAYLPLYSLRAACGRFGAEERVEPEGWVRVRGVHAPNRRLYVVRAVGHSMEPRIHDGEYKVFEFRNGACNPGEIVLAEHTGVVDSETTGAYSIKRFEERIEHGERVEARLVPVNRDYPTIMLRKESGPALDYRIVGSLKDDVRIG